VFHSKSVQEKNLHPIESMKLIIQTKRLTSSKPKVEMGTQGNGDIDYDWIPKENLRRTSPRRRGHNSGSELSGSE